MSKSHSHVKHMSADAEDKFEENMEGESFGSLDDWEMELGLKILKVEEKANSVAGIANIPVRNMLVKKLVTYNAALSFLDGNPKAAVILGNEGGLAAIIAFITKQAIEDATKAETRAYSNLIMEQLPGYKLSRHAQVLGGMIRPPVAQAAQAQAAIPNRYSVPPVSGSSFLSA